MAVTRPFALQLKNLLKLRLDPPPIAVERQAPCFETELGHLDQLAVQLNDGDVDLPEVRWSSPALANPWTPRQQTRR